MSIVVDLQRLSETLADYPYGYLLTTSGGAVKAVTITATVLDDRVVIPTGSGGSARNLAENSTATLLFPPTQHHGYSLIVDGSAAATDEGFTVTPARAVLHRPADHNDLATDADAEVAHTHDSTCGHDCQPL